MLLLLVHSTPDAAGGNFEPDPYDGHLNHQELTKTLLDLSALYREAARIGVREGEREGGYRDSGHSVCVHTPNHTHTNVCTLLCCSCSMHVSTSCFCWSLYIRACC